MSDTNTNGSGGLTQREASDKLAEQFLRSLDIMPKSRETYRKSINRYLDWLGDKDPITAERDDILDFKDDMMERSSPYTVSCYMTIVRGFYAHLEKEGLAENIAVGIKGAARGHTFSKDALTVSQAKRVLAMMDRTTAEGKRDYALLNLLLRTGIRTVEAERANINDICRRNGDGKEALLRIEGKGRWAKETSVVLTTKTMEPLMIYLGERSGATPNEPLFISFSDRNRGERLTTRSMSRIAKNALRAAGFDSSRLTAHSMRHTALTLSLMGENNVPHDVTRRADEEGVPRIPHIQRRFDNPPERTIDALLDSGE
ncbi:MAG: site-specific integrase [Clostridiales bacterium]|jgi:site-specific recombinase XerD|nr:site-specific integrase [Clostridiales bacterium]MDR2749062.1 site-specific integrase [Clostridiales bacterium]